MTQCCVTISIIESRIREIFDGSATNQNISNDAIFNYLDYIIKKKVIDFEYIYNNK